MVRCPLDPHSTLIPHSTFIWNFRLLVMECVCGNGNPFWEWQTTVFKLFRASFLCRLNCREIWISRHGIWAYTEILLNLEKYHFLCLGHFFSNSIYVIRNNFENNFSHIQNHCSEVTFLFQLNNPDIRGSLDKLVYTGIMLKVKNYHILCLEHYFWIKWNLFTSSDFISRLFQSA